MHQNAMLHLKQLSKAILSECIDLLPDDRFAQVRKHIFVTRRFVLFIHLKIKVDVYLFYLYKPGFYPR